MIAIATKLCIDKTVIEEALAKFKSVKRRLEIKGIVNNITVYDDFAHHPTALAATVAALRNKIGKQRIIALVELGSYTMRSGMHCDALLPALQKADTIIFYQAGEHQWEINGNSEVPWYVYNNAEALLEKTLQTVNNGDHILIMSNRGFAQIHEKLLTALAGEYHEQAS